MVVLDEHRVSLLKSLIRRKYRRDPVRYIEKVLKITLTPDQKKAADLLIKHKRLIVRASHGVGKSVLVAALTNWFFDCFANSITITTAPTAAQVVDVVWREIRKLRKGRRGLLPKAPRMEYNAGWFAVGMTAAKGDAFQGRHSIGGVLICTDESTGVKRDIHDACEGMMVDFDKCFWIHILNPTDPSAYVKELEDSGKFAVMIISALEHPNVIWALEGRIGLIPFPGAVTLEWINERVAAWCQPIQAAHILAGDFEWPPGAGAWFRPGPLFEGRVLGIWPSLAFDNVWSDGHYQSCLKPRETDENEPLEVGCDVARYGDDFTVLFIRRGRSVLEHIRYNGNGITITRDEIIALIHRHTREDEGPQGVPIKVDDDGVGGGLVDVLNEMGYNVIPVNAGSTPFEPENYPNRRSELWFVVAERAAELRVDLSRLSSDSLAILKPQLTKPKYRVDGQGRRVVEPKIDLKKKDRLGYSPDDADALNLCFAPAIKRNITDIDDWK